MGLSNNFLQITPEAQATNKNKQVVLYQTKKSICTAKEDIDNVKRQITEWEKIFANHISDKGLISKTYKDLIQLNSKNKNPNNLIKR